MSFNIFYHKIVNEVNIQIGRYLFFLNELTPRLTMPIMSVCNENENEL